ncbi:telomere length regulation protein-domain-containing protein [Mycotypha africana]|uniref:telomere length regulation protein-domain-containing protein n=1 Tax=Mycotypha africana TaxID=64632 RepID=UPI002300AC3B|nr:telomere length regulation protein-domain-containing protein [Mycotypha africana]KAI8988408.1 telomere length regulation protein-domain-containing protein [Mycotypha africana]
MSVAIKAYVDQLIALDEAALAAEATLENMVECISQPLQWLQSDEQLLNHEQQVALMRHESWKKHVWHIYRDILPRWTFAFQNHSQNRTLLKTATLSNPAASEEVRYHMAAKSLPILIECITDEQQRHNAALDLLDIYALSLKKLSLSADILFLYAKFTPDRDCRFLVSLLCSIPSHLANTFGVHSQDMSFYTEQEWFFDRKFYARLSRHLAECLREHTVRFTVELATKIIRQGYEDLFMESIYPIACTHHTDLWPHVFEQVEAMTSTEQIVKPILSYVRNTIVPNTTIKTASVQLAHILLKDTTTAKTASSSTDKLRVFAFLNTSRLKLSRVTWADEILVRLIISTVIQAEGCPNDTHLSDSAHTILLDYAKTCLKTWSDPVFIKHGTSRERHYLTIFILVLLAYLPTEDIETHIMLETRFMSSVHQYFDSGDKRTAAYGALMAESISSRVDKEKKLNTGLLESMDDFSVLKELIYTKDAFEQVTSESNTVPLTENESEDDKDESGEDEEMDPDAEFIVTDDDIEEEEDQEEEEDDDDDLQPYYMEEESDDEGVKEDGFSKKPQDKRKPVYVRDLICYLRDQEDPVKLEIGLNAAEQIIRQKAGAGTELNESSIELAKYLITFPDAYEIDHARQLQQAALVALMAAVPATVTGFIIDELYDRNTSTGQKQLILGSISLAVRELAGWSLSGNADETEKGVTEIEKKLEDISLSAENSLVRQQVGKPVFMSRKMALEKQQKTVQKNRLAGLAGPVFFFPLLVGWWEGAQGRIKYWLGNNQIVAERFILTLNIILHSATNTPDKRKIVKEYFEFALSMRYAHQQSVGVKKALLLGIETIISVSYGGQEKLLFYDYRNELEQVKDWLADIMESHSEEQLQEITVRILVRISKIALAELRGSE